LFVSGGIPSGYGGVPTEIRVVYGVVPDSSWTVDLSGIVRIRYVAFRPELLLPSSVCFPDRIRSEIRGNLRELTGASPDSCRFRPDPEAGIIDLGNGRCKRGKRNDKIRLARTRQIYIYIHVFFCLPSHSRCSGEKGVVVAIQWNSKDIETMMNKNSIQWEVSTHRWTDILNSMASGVNAFHKVDQMSSFFRWNFQLNFSSRWINSISSSVRRCKSNTKKSYSYRQFYFHLFSTQVHHYDVRLKYIEQVELYVSDYKPVGFILLSY
jgi:hypothetical protein